MIIPAKFMNLPRAAPVAAPKTPSSDEDGLTKGNCTCGQCMGTGQYVTGTNNGKPVFGQGICYRCEGKGYHTEADRKRNYGYNFHRKLA